MACGSAAGCAIGTSDAATTPPGGTTSWKPPVAAPPAVEPAAPIPVEHEPERFDFTVVVRGGDPVEVVPGPGGGVVLARTAMVEIDGAAGRVQWKPYGNDALPQADGMASGFTLRSAGGTWPDAVFTSDSYPMGACGGGPTLQGMGVATWTRSTWRTSPSYRSMDAWARWSGAATIAVENRMPYLSSDGQGIALAAFGDGAPKVPAPASAPEGVKSPMVGGEEWTSTPCATRMGSAAGLAALPSGEVFVVGSLCATDGAAVEWWDANGDEHLAPMPPVDAGIMNVPRASPSRWPVASGAVASIVARSPAQVDVGGSREGHAYLATFDGHGWRAVAAPMRAAITSMAGLPGASLWATTADGELWRQAPGGEWSQVPLGRPARKVRVGAPGEVWVVSNDAVLRSAPLERPVELPGLDPEHPERQWETERATASCSSVFTALYPVADADGRRDVDMPKTRGMLQGHPELASSRFVVTVDGTFGAITADLEAAEHVAAVFREARPGTRPNLLCQTPVVRRELRFVWAGDDVSQGADL